MPEQSNTKLSICITTFNRGRVIGATLESIIAQLTTDCELIVLDGGSTDETPSVVSNYALRCDLLRYFKQERNNGFDRDCDRAVQLAEGEYCWLMTDDDLLKPGAVATVLQRIRRDFSLVIVNSEVRDFTMSKIIRKRWLDLECDRVYETGESDRLVIDAGDMLIYVGGVIVRRSVWLAREKDGYYGSLFIYLGVMLQDPLPQGALVIAEPLISYRMGNTHTFSPRMFEAFMISLPSLIWSLDLSDAAKRRVCEAEPWRRSWQLLRCRGQGSYSLSEYRLWIRPRLHSFSERLIPIIIGLLPGVIINALFVFYYLLTPPNLRGTRLEAMRGSRFHFRNWKLFKPRFMSSAFRQISP